MHKLKLMLRLRSLQHLEAISKLQKPPWSLIPIFAYSDASAKKLKVAPLQETRMRDRITICAKGGDGGSGCASVRRSRHDRRGKPDGGNGGRGGDVILECTPSIWDFSGLQPHIRAGRGGQGASKNKIGIRGENKVVYVPVGTVVHLVKGEIPSTVQKSCSAELDPWELPGSLSGDPPELNQLCDAEKHSVQLEALPKESSVGIPSLTSATKAGSEDNKEIKYSVAELTEQGQRITVAVGGEGGMGSVCAPNIFRKPKNTPTVYFKNNISEPQGSEDDETSLRCGLPGSETVMVLELKSIADVGLVGMPNAGKSTLLGALSRARPRVGHYAFTTLRPNLGNLNFDDFSITVADIPGLIKNAHQDRGLGHNFLRHIERTKVLAYVVDLAAGSERRKGIPPWEQLKVLVAELEYHQEGLSKRPALVVANKIDETGADEVYRELERRVRGVPMYPICAVLEEGVTDLKEGLRMLMSEGNNSQTLGLENIDVS